MSFNISIDGRNLGKLRKYFKAYKRVGAFFTKMESFHYACKHMQKKGYGNMSDIIIGFKDGQFTIWIPAFHKGIYINRRTYGYF
jgi:hypothetical protein